MPSAPRPAPDIIAPVLETVDLHKRYGGVHALKGVDLRIERGRSYHLLGENGCGKSTLIKIISGAQAATSGRVFIDGEEWTELDPISALKAGIETVYQDLSLLPNLTVEENIGLSGQLVACDGALTGLLDRRQMRASAVRATEAVGLPSGRAFLTTAVDRLPIATRQLIAIARAIAGKAKLVIMDEPTTALTRREVDHLMTVVRGMQRDGTALLFVTHKLDEAREIGGRGIVMRDGAFIGEMDMADADAGEIGFMMTGRRLEQGRYRTDTLAPDVPVLLRVEGLGKRRGYDDISFDLRRGEILGITGLLDSGRNELALTLAGLLRADRGTIALNGTVIDAASPAEAISAGIAYVPEDRLTEGLFLDKSIRENIGLSVFDKLRNALGIFSRKASTGLAERTLTDLKIVAPDVEAPVSSLSGGNQQRVLIGRWLAAEPDVLVMHGPTVGVDVGSKDTIFRIIQKNAELGKGIVIVSDDLPELLQNCDRILVMRAGGIGSVLKAETTDVDMLYAAISATTEAAA